MYAVAYLLGALIDAIRYSAEVNLYIFHALWVTLVRFAINVVEAVDDWLPGYDILDNSLLRGLIMGGVGFLTGVALMIFLALIVGAWFIPCAFWLTILFFFFLGVIADPDQDWSFGDFPRWRDLREPKVPLNL